MLRIKDPVRSLAFYRDVLGMTYADVISHDRSMLMPHVSLFHEMPVARGKFTNYFLAYAEPGEVVATDAAELHRQLFGRQGVVELCQCAPPPPVNAN